MNKNVLQALGCGFLLVTIASCAPKVYDSMRYQSTGITVDGKLQEWSNPLRYYDPASKLSYEITNDAENVYVAFSTRERSTMTKIMRKGLKFSIDTTSKKKYPIQFTFPYRNPNDFNPFFEQGVVGSDSVQHRYIHDSAYYRNRMANGSHRDSGATRPRRALKMIVTGIKTTKDGDSVLSMPNDYGIEVALGRDEDAGKMLGELKIPFKVFLKDQIVASDTAKPLFFQINLQANDTASHHRPPNDPNSGFSGGGRGGANGGGYGGGGGRSGRGGYGGGGGRGDQSGGNAYDNSANTANVIRFQYRLSITPPAGTDKK